MIAHGLGISTLIMPAVYGTYTHTVSTPHPPSANKNAVKYLAISQWSYLIS